MEPSDVNKTAVLKTKTKTSAVSTKERPRHQTADIIVTFHLGSLCKKSLQQWRNGHNIPINNNNNNLDTTTI